MQAQLCSRLIAKFLISNCGVATNSFLIGAKRLWAHRADRLPEVADAVVVPAHAARIEAQVAGEAAAVREERTRPVEADTACTTKIVAVATASRRKKYGVTVYFTCYFISVYTVLSCPFQSTDICIS